jgi:hypothetical protein
MLMDKTLCRQVPCSRNEWTRHTSTSSTGRWFEETHPLSGPDPLLVISEIDREHLSADYHLGDLEIQVPITSICDTRTGYYSVHNTKGEYGSKSVGNVAKRDRWFYN